MFDKIIRYYSKKSAIKKKFDDTYNELWTVKEYKGLGKVLHCLEFVAVLTGSFIVLLSIILKAAKIPDELVFWVAIAGIGIILIDLVIAQMQLCFSDYNERVVDNVKKVMEHLFRGYEKMTIPEKTLFLMECYLSTKKLHVLGWKKLQERLPGIYFL